ncbi:hypothetical protein PCORN_03293 [Listeria cornellensis FSL F6-0969]|uniref:Uncharacterized protein n=1 Tax=Listeria cornellensis FSL F6-0969 TaxID=1265820 RepID=W7C515_9LIST|nr:hypothetical protein PCORN_03293 [Listeria cornellensis FSL F6-0969]
MDKTITWRIILLILSVIIPLGVILAAYVFISNRKNKQSTKKWIDIGCAISFIYTTAKVIFLIIDLRHFVLL